MNTEPEALESNNTWQVTTLPPNKQAIGCKWLFKTKYNPDGTVERYKSRLVILGCKQVHVIDFLETFAPVAKMSTVRAILAVTAMNDWLAYQMDVTNVFLYGDLEEIIYMKLPKGYTGPGSRVSLNQGESPSSTLVCKLIKSLYGLRQSPRLWFHKLSVTLQSNKFV